MADTKKDNSEQNQDPKKLDDKPEVKTDILFDSRDSQVAATVSLNLVFTLLHEKALKEASSAVGNIEIVNSAVNDKGKFLGAGQHAIIALPKADDLIKEDCLNAILTYVQWFSGPDVAKTITLDSLTPLTRPLTDEEKNKDLKKALDDKESEAKGNPTENDSEEKPKKKTKKEKNKELANESLETYIYQIDNNMFSILFESTLQQDEEDAKKDGLKITGYLAQYLLDIPGLKTLGFVLTMKNVGKYFAKGLANLLGGIGFLFWDWRSGAKGEVHKLGDMAKKLVKKISPDKLVSAVKEEFSKKFPGNSIDLAVLDSKSIVNHLAKRLPSADKGKILKIPYALCIKVNKSDKNYELVNKKAIAKFVKDGLSKIKENVINLNFKTWQKGISENSVILVNNYTDLHYNPDANKHGQANANAKKIKTKEENSDAKAGVSNESVEDVFKMYKMIFENLDLTDLENYITEALLEDNNDDIESSKDTEEDTEKQRIENATELEDKDISNIFLKIKEFAKNKKYNEESNILKLNKFKKLTRNDLYINLIDIILNELSYDEQDIKNILNDNVQFKLLKDLHDNTITVLNDFNEELREFERSGNKFENLKKKVITLKYLYIKNKIKELKDNKLLNIKINGISFDCEDSDYDKIKDINISDINNFNVNYDKLSKVIDVSNDEAKLFSNKTDLDLEDIAEKLNSNKVKEALKKLSDKKEQEEKERIAKEKEELERKEQEEKERIAKEKEELERKAELLRKDKATKLEDKDYEDIASKINEFYKNSDLAKQNDKLVRFIKHEKDKLTKAIAEILSENKDGNINKDILSSKLKGINFDELKELRDNTENYLLNFEIKVDNFENSNENTEALKKKIMPIKYLYVKNNILKLLDKDLLKDFDFDIKFNNIDTKLLDNDKVVITDGKISDKDYEKLSNIIPISNKETALFEDFSDADFEKCISELQSEKVKEANENLKDAERKDKATKLEDKDYEDIASKIKLFIIDNNLENEKEKLENLKNNSHDELDQKISLLLSLYKSSNKKTDITRDRLKNKIENVDFNELKKLRDNTDGYLKDLLVKLDDTKKSDNKTIRLKMAIMPIKFRYIKYRIDKLKEKGYYKPEGKFVDFDIPTNQNTLDFITSCKGKKFDSDDKNETDGRHNFTKEIYDELNKQIPITDDEVKKFEGFTNKDFEQARNNVLNDAGKPTLIALQKLATEIKDKFDKIKDEKTKQKLFPGVNGKKELEKKLDDKNSNIWDLGVTRMFEVLDDINLKEADREGNKKALDKTKTDKDMYIIPISGLDFDSKK